MSLWRAKKRFDANQDLTELADRTLFAIILLRSDINNNDSYSDSDVRAALDSGVEILRDLKECVENPESAANYYLALANHLRRTGQKQTTEQFKQELTHAISILQTTSNTLEWSEDLNDVEPLFRRMEQFTSEASSRNLDTVKSNLAARNRGA